MSDAWHSPKITQFEQVATGSSRALLRLTGTSRQQQEATPGDRPALVIDDGRRVSRYAPLPSPADEPGVLRAAYSVPGAVITPESTFSLELKDGHPVSLPAPAPRARGETAPAAPPAADAQTQEALRQDVAAANRRAEDALLEAATARDQREALEQRNAALGQSLRERQAALDELEVWRSELERRLASMSTELGETTARLRAAEQQLAALGVPVDVGGGGVDAGPADAAGAEPSATPADAPADLEELRRLAAAAASEQAARELAEAGADQVDPGR